MFLFQYKRPYFASTSLPAHLVDAFPPLAPDDLFPKRHLAIGTSDRQYVPGETPRDPPHGIREERVRVIVPMREEFGRGPGRSRGRSEVDLDGSVLRGRVGYPISPVRPGWDTIVARRETHLSTRSDVFTGEPDIGRPRDVPDPIGMRIQSRLDLGTCVGVPIISTYTTRRSLSVREQKQWT